MNLSGMGLKRWSSLCQMVAILDRFGLLVRFSSSAQINVVNQMREFFIKWG